MPQADNLKFDNCTVRTTENKILIPNIRQFYTLVFIDHEKKRVCYLWLLFTFKTSQFLDQHRHQLYETILHPCLFKTEERVVILPKKAH
jgi:hypothetical protein